MATLSDMAALSSTEAVMTFDERQRHAVRGQLLNLITAAEAHVTWKTRLGHHVRGTIREPLEPDQLGDGGFCQLGMWLNGTASEPFRETGAYLQLGEAHRKFHQLGALIILRLRAGDRDGAARLFDEEYSAALRDIVKSLAEFNRCLFAE